MTVWPLTFEILITFTLSAFLIYRYGNYVQQHTVTTVSVFIAWFFSFLVIFILPLDISTVCQFVIFVLLINHFNLDFVSSMFESGQFIESS